MMRQKDSQKNRRMVAPIFVNEALACGDAAGVDITTLLKDAAVSADDLNQLDTDGFARIWLALSATLSDEFFSLGVRPMRPGSTTLLGHAIRQAKTLEVAVQRTLRFLRVVLDEPYGTLETNKSDCKITIAETNPSQHVFTYRAFFLILHGFNCWVAKERIPIKSISFPCPEPEGANDYVDFFGVPVTFDAPVASLVFDRKFLGRKVDRSEGDLKTFLRSLPEAFLRGYKDTGGLKHIIIETCLKGPAEDWPDAVAVAARLGMSRSSLHRQLKAEGHSLTQLKDEQRRNRATVLLSRTDLPISDVSAAVGYAEESAFFRAFHRWYAATPNQFRSAGLPPSLVDG
ncbi:AraC family transcriptional regulator [Yoonia sp. I 8.24]|uniref:AraC family transcriptional regulator n=1 Tax=Yoonia sp. I 8.24 TaxID=1537229 RepID=UPI001EDF5422|nr:AraC family transcriptional regulator [Yoonia sp. I 8.24]MCG3267104.1 AraC family transcriptional regulator [Yoonia sp. I 8.24]